MRRRVQLEGVVLVDTALLRGSRYISAIPVDGTTTVRGVVEQIVQQFECGPDGITLQLVLAGLTGMFS